MEMRKQISNLGFEDVDTGERIADARRFLTGREECWIITCLYIAEKDNGLELLDNILKQNIPGLRISFLVDERERQYLPEAFEKGLLNYFELPFKPETFAAGLEELMHKGQLLDQDSALVAAEYLRRWLKESQDWENMERLEGAMQQVYPEHAHSFVSMGETQLELGRVDEARRTFRQALYLDPDTDSSINEILARFRESGRMVATSLGLQRVMVVDPDPDVVAALTDLLTGMFGVEEVLSFADGKEAWEALKGDEEIEMVIHEWKLRSLGGSQFLQRIRHQGYPNLPVIILSSLVQPKDEILIKELFVAGVVRKPMVKKQMEACINEVLLQETFPTEERALEQKIVEQLHNRNLEEARRLKKKYFSGGDRSPGRVKYLDAEFAYAAKRYKQASKLVLESIKLLGRESLPAMNLLGKCLMALNDLKGALRCFEKAREISPENIQRICQIADLQSDLGCTYEADETVAVARELDDEAEAVKKSEVRLAMAKGDDAGSRELMQGLTSTSEMVSQMNNRAVAYIRAGDFRQGNKIYDETLQAIPEGDTALRARVLYNVGLARARQGELEESVRYLRQCYEMREEVVLGKVKSLLMKAATCLKTGDDLVLNTSDQEETEDEEEEELPPESEDDNTYITTDNAELPLPVNAGRCLNQIFRKIA